MCRKIIRSIDTLHKNKYNYSIFKEVFLMKKIIALLLSILLIVGCASMGASAKEERAFKNVILMIGDGMGPNHLNLAKQERFISLFMEDECDAFGYSKTRSFSSPVTDSAAGGTALSSGVRITNHSVAVYPMDPLGWITVPRTLCEAAKLAGMRSGVITTDTNDGATPASFTAHTSHRSNYEDICTQQAKSDFDIIWGAKSSKLNPALCEENGFTMLYTKDDMMRLKPGTKSFAQFDYDTMWRTEAPEGSTSPILSEMTTQAIRQLDNENGFFLMIEGAHIDKWSHTSNSKDNYDNKVACAAEAVEEFDHAIETAVNFARQDGNTLVVITADHETGGITLKDGKYVYTKNEHSGVNVPLIVFGMDDFVKDGEAIENRQVSQKIGVLLGFNQNFFPQHTPGKIVRFLSEALGNVKILFKGVAA